MTSKTEEASPVEKQDGVSSADARSAKPSRLISLDVLR